MTLDLLDAKRGWRDGQCRFFDGEQRGLRHPPPLRGPQCRCLARLSGARVRLGQPSGASGKLAGRTNVPVLEARQAAGDGALRLDSIKSNKRLSPWLS